jgi:two-component sensor histidine kinase
MGEGTAMPSLSLRRLAAISLPLLGLLPLLMLAALLWPALRGLGDSEMRASSGALLGRLAERIGARLVDDPRRSLSAAVMLAGISGGEEGRRDILRAIAIPNPDYSALLLLDAKGEVSASYPADLVPSGMAYSLHAPVLPGDLSISAPFASRLVPGLVVELSYGNPEWTALAFLGLSSIASGPLLRADSARGDGDAPAMLGVVDGEGRLIMCSDPSRMARGELLPARGKGYFVSTRPIAGSPWRAAYYRPLREADAPISAFLTRLLALALVAAAFSAAAASAASMREAFDAMAEAIERRDRALREKEAFGRARKDLRVLSGLFAMQSSSIGDEKAAEALASARSRVFAMSLAHELVMRSSGRILLDFAEYAERLSSSLAASRGLGGAALRFELEPLRIGLEEALPLGLALNEMARNAFEHASPRDGAFPLLVSVGERKGRRGPEAFIAVEDSGPGMPEDPWFLPRGSMGLHLIRVLALRLRGSASWSPPASGRGTRVELCFPLGEASSLRWLSSI